VAGAVMDDGRAGSEGASGVNCVSGTVGGAIGAEIWADVEGDWVLRSHGLSGAAMVKARVRKGEENDNGDRGVEDDG